MSLLAPLLKYFYRYRWRLLLGVLFVSCVNMMGVLAPKVVGDALDMVFSSLRFVRLSEGFEVNALLKEDLAKGLMGMGGLLLLIALIQGLFMYAMRQTIIVVSRLIEYDLRRDIFSHFTKLDLGFYRSQKVGDMMARITEDVSKVRNFLGPAVLYGINLITLFSFVIVAMIRQSPLLTFYSLIPLPFLSLSIYYVSRVIHTQSHVIQTQLSRINSLAQEIYSGIRILKSFVHEKQIGVYFDEECVDYRDKSLKLARTNALFFPLMLFFIGLSTILTIYYGGRQVIEGKMTPGTIAEFVIYVNMLTWPVTSLGWISSIIQQASVSMKRISEFWETKPDIINPSTEQEKLKGSVTFDNVSFTYPNTGIEAIKEASFDIEAGEKILVVGRSGSGKTTIADLIMRLFDATSGTIKIDGKPLTDWNLDSLRNQIGYVQQDVFLFSETVQENVQFGNQDATKEDAIRYTSYAQIHEEIERLTEGYDTRIGERGTMLSGGQKQRISIARSIIREPQLFIFDDCLSAVDATTEIEISKFFDEILKDKTAIIITHRLNPYIKFDKVLVMDGGRVGAFGGLEQVVESNAYFQKMYNKLFDQQEAPKDLSKN